MKIHRIQHIPLSCCFVFCCRSYLSVCDLVTPVGWTFGCWMAEGREQSWTHHLFSGAQDSRVRGSHASL